LKEVCIVENIRREASCWFFWFHFLMIRWRYELQGSLLAIGNGEWSGIWEEAKNVNGGFHYHLTLGFVSCGIKRDLENQDDGFNLYTAMIERLWDGSTHQPETTNYSMRYQCFQN
jgi:hypothetical protein